MTDDSKDIQIESENNNQKINKKNVEWTEEHENILIEWADKAMCYRWLHSKAHHKYAKANAWFTIPVIIMSTITGTANFAQDRFSDDVKPLASMCIGAVNIFAGILTTIQQFLKISELNESHRVASIAWDKFYRNIKVELAKSPIERTPVIQLIRHSKDEFDRLMETSPSISNDIIKSFNETFSAGVNKLDSIDQNLLTVRQKAYLELKKPEICDTIETTRKTIYDRAKHDVSKLNMNLNVCIQNSLEQKALDQKALDQKEKLKKNDKANTFIQKFKETRKRLPTIQEVYDELDGDIETEIIHAIIDNHNKNFIENIVIEMTPTGENNV